MNKHTPGPWTVGEFEVLFRNQRTVNPSICTVFGTEHETLLNARLIAAAPDLLAVVEELEESSEYWSEYFVPLGIVDRLRAALAKARGEVK